MHHSFTYKLFIFAAVLGAFLGSALFVNSFQQAQTPFRSDHDIDMLMKHWNEGRETTMFGTLDVRVMLTRNETGSQFPTEKGAVLTDLLSVNHAVLRPRRKTETSTLDGRQLLLYIVSGDGAVRTDTRTEELHDGIGILIPPDVEFVLENSADVPLIMYMIEEPVPAGFTPVTDIVLHYEYDNTISTNTSRVESDQWLFNPYDGLTTLVSFNPVMYEPKSLTPMHYHPEGTEEVWIAVRGDLMIQVGNQRRELPAGTAYRAPADGRTPHANINTSDSSKKMLWMMKTRQETVSPQQREQQEDDIDMI